MEIDNKFTYKAIIKFNNILLLYLSYACINVNLNFYIL